MAERIQVARFRNLRFLVLALIVTLLAAAQLRAQQMPVTPELQLSLFARILPFDRNFTERVGDEVVVGVVYQEQFRQSSRAKDAFFSAYEDGSTHTVGDIPFQLVPIPLTSISRAALAIQGHEVDVLYVTPLRGVDLRQISALGVKSRLVTLTGVPQYLDQGVAVAIGERAGRPELVVNLPASREQGADFSSEFLRLATVKR